MSHIGSLSLFLSFNSFSKVYTPCHTGTLLSMIMAPEEACTALQLCAAALRRAVQDMGKLKKALEKMRKQASRTRPTNGGGEDAAATRVLVGRTNFQKSLSPNDPEILRSIKTLLTKRPMKTVKDTEELTNGTCDSALPFVMRKGRGLAKLLVKDAALRGSLDATAQEFCKMLEGGTESKSVFLGFAVCSDFFPFPFHSMPVCPSLWLSHSIRHSHSIFYPANTRPTGRSRYLDHS